MVDRAGALQPAFSALITLTNPWLEHRPGAPSLPDDLKWPEVLAHARRHRVVPFLAHRLERLGMLGDLPVEIADALRREARLAQFHEMALLGVLRRLAHTFAGESVAFMVVKGLVLSSSCHGRLGLRTNRDIDLLIEPAQLDAAHALLIRMGFERVEPAGQPSLAELASWTRRNKDWVYTDPADGAVVELHHRLFDNRALFPLDRVRGGRRVELFGHVEIDTLDRENELAYLALHGAHHAWSRLKWLLDIAFLFRKAGPEALAAMIVREGGGPAARALRQAAMLCHGLFGTDPAPGLNLSRIDSLLAACALKAMTEGGSMELEESRFGTTLKNASHYLLWQHPVYLANELAYDLRDTSREQREGQYFLPIWISRPCSWFVRRLVSPR